MSLISERDGKHDQRARQTNSEDCCDCAPRATQAVPREDRDICSIEAGKRFADRQHLNEGRIIQPAPLCDQAAPQVRDEAPTNAGRTDNKKRGKYLAERETLGRSGELRLRCP